MQIEGTTAPGFEAVRTAFTRGFTERGEVGAGVCIIHRGRVVVDLWGGMADPVSGRAWRRDTLVHVYSTTKPLVAACVLVLVDRGAVELDAPVIRHWPEFGQAGKERVTVRQLLSHQAGLLALRDPVPGQEIFDWERMIARLEAEVPWWEPGTAHGEHGYFYGHLVGELVRRVDGRRISRFFAEEIATPLGLDFSVGVPESERGRVALVSGLAELFPGGHPPEVGSVYDLALSNPPGALLDEVVNSDAWMAAEIPAVNGFGTAAAVARFYQVLLDGGVRGGRRVLSETMCREATSIQSSGRDEFLERHVDWGLGLKVEDGGYGHGGLGGSSGYADPALDLAYAYVTNRMGEHDRTDAVEQAAEAAIRLVQASHEKETQEP